MEVKQPMFSTSYNNSYGNRKHRFKDSRKEKEEKDEEQEHLNLRSLSKVIIPPLGASSNYTQNHVNSRFTKIISPMDSKYR